MNQFLTLLFGLVWFLIQLIIYQYIIKRNNKLNNILKKKFNLLYFIEGMFNFILGSAVLFSSLLIFAAKPKCLSGIDFNLYLGEFVILMLTAFFFWALIIKRAFRKPR